MKTFIALSASAKFSSLLQLDSNGFKSWRREIREKIKFSFSHRLDRSLSDLKELNDEFRALADQISKLEERRSNKVTAATPQQFLDLHKFNVIQKASNLLYESLGAACTEHEEHIAHFCLQPDLNEQSSPRVRFSIAFRHLSVAGSATVEDPIWFAVESIISKSLANNPAGVCTALTNLSNSLKRREQSPPACHSKRSKRTVTSTSSSSVVRCPSPPLIDSLPNLCVHQNLCNQIQVCLRQSSLMSNRYIGLLEEGPDCRHLVYLPSSTKHWDRKSTSLANLFVSVSRQSLRGSLPIYERLRLAKLLAAAVLQFHSTPWLKGSWRSEDVLFFGVEPGATEPTQATKFTAPYIDVSVTAPNGSFSRPSTFPSRIFAPNPFLFGLGVMLLELAYETPIRNLMRPIDLDNGQEDQHTEFFVARRLSRSGSSQMGLKYNEIARSCLHCDFGCGDDLNDAKLQQEFYRKVVCELGALEKGFRKMQLGN